MIEVEVGGQIYEFAPGTPDNVIKSVIERDQTSIAAKEAANPDSIIAEEKARREGLLRDPSIAGRAADVARPIVQGATAGGGDEIVAQGVEALGGDYDSALEFERNQLERFREANPYLSTGLEMGGGVLGSMLLSRIPGVDKMTDATMSLKPLPLLGNAGLAGAAAGTYGFLSGEGGVESRLDNAAEMVPLGAALGPVSTLALRTGTHAANAFRDWRAKSKAENEGAEAAGFSRAAFNMLRGPAAQMDEDLRSVGGARTYLDSRGQRAMLGDVLPSELDYTANVGAGSYMARRNLGQRVSEASAEVADAIDQTFGTARGRQDVFDEISQSTRGKRRDSYDDFYDAPIIYTPDRVDIVNDALDQIPDRILRKAIQGANEKMTVRYGKGPMRQQRRQIEYRERDDGSLEFVTERLSMEQMDYMKRALMDMSENAKGEFGRSTPESDDYANMAGALRRALLDVSPVDDQGVTLYQRAMDAGMDKISQDNAFKLGMKMLRETNKIEPEDVARAARDWSEADKQRVREGLRNHLYSVMRRVTKIRSDPNLDQRQADALLKQLTTDDAQEKLRIVLGDREAEGFLNTMGRAWEAFNVRAGAAPNSQTAPRGFTHERLTNEAAGFGPPLAERRPPGLNDVLLQAPIRLLNAATGNTRGAQQQTIEATQREMAEALTGLRGIDALRALDRLLRAHGTTEGRTVPSALRSQMLVHASRLAAPPALNYMMDDY